MINFPITEIFPSQLLYLFTYSIDFYIKTDVYDILLKKKKMRASDAHFNIGILILGLMQMFREFLKFL